MNDDLLSACSERLAEPWSLWVPSARRARAAIAARRWEDACFELDATFRQLERRQPPPEALLQELERGLLIAALHAGSQVTVERLLVAQGARPGTQRIPEMQSLAALAAFVDALRRDGVTRGLVALARGVNHLFGDTALAWYVRGRVLEAYLAGSGESLGREALREATQAAAEAFVAAADRAMGSPLADAARARYAFVLADHTVEAAGYEDRAAEARPVLASVNPLSLPAALRLRFAATQLGSSRRMARVQALDAIVWAAEHGAPEDAAAALLLLVDAVAALDGGPDALERDRIEHAVAAFRVARRGPAFGAASTIEAPRLDRIALQLDRLEAFDRLHRGEVGLDALTEGLSGRERDYVYSVLGFFQGGGIPIPMRIGALAPWDAALLVLSLIPRPTDPGDGTESQGIAVAADHLRATPAATLCSVIGRVASTYLDPRTRPGDLRPLAAWWPVCLGRWDELASQHDPLRQLAWRYAAQAPAPSYGFFPLAKLFSQRDEAALAAAFAVRSAREARAATGAPTHDTALAQLVAAGACALIEGRRFAEARALLLDHRDACIDLDAPRPTPSIPSS